MVTAHRRAGQTTKKVACMLTDQVGDAVYIRGNINGPGLWKVARADYTLESKMPAVGVIIAKWNFTNALVRLFGPVEGIYSGLEYGKTYWVGANGKPERPIPSATGGAPRAYTQVLGVALDSNILMVKPSPNVTVRTF